MHHHRKLFVLFILTAVAAFLPATGSAAAKPGFDHGHAVWDKVLKDFSDQGWVEYKRLKAAPKDLDRYLAGLASVDRKEEASWPREKRLAFWINAYNAFTVKAITDHYPPRASNFIKRKMYGELSIRHIKDVWEEEVYQAAGRKLSLNHIEHEILRKELKEPRIHFAIVCASIGCPPLITEAFTAKRLDGQFEDGIKKFLGRKENFELDLSGDELKLSPILKWFAEDFGQFDGGKMGRYPKKARGGLSFLSRRLPPESVRAIRERGLSFSWIKYDWSLNEK